ncbi:MAG: porin family protein [Endomicrobium sp.]|jgi:hypothetical protein|nr:porin family protein [Endomicrobium sp.]
MKKILFLFLVLLLAQNVYADKKNSLILKFGITPYSELTSNIEYSEVFDIKFPDEKSHNYPNVGTVLYFEYYRNINNVFDLGIGISQQLYRAGMKPRYFYRDNEEFQICFTSFYLSPKLKIYRDLYCNLHFGINKLWATETEANRFDRDYIGLYCALGVGYEYKNFIFEFLYARNYAKHEADFLKVRDYSGIVNTMIISLKETYETFNFNIGYKFNFNFPDIKRADNESKKTKNVFADKNNEVVIKLGITPYSVLSQKVAYPMENIYTYSDSSDINTGTVFYLEYFRNINLFFKLGIGLEQQLSRNDSRFDFFWMYASSIYITPKINVYNDIYCVLQIGVSRLAMAFDDLYDERNIGLHYGAGLGYEYKNFIFEFLYISNNAINEIYMGDTLVHKNNINYQTFNFNIGYKFNFNFPDIKRADKESKKAKVQERKKSEKELLIEQNELLKKQIELLEQKIN